MKMFQFVYALSADETLDSASLRVEEFDAFESSDDLDHGVPVRLRRVTNPADVSPDIDALVWRPTQDMRTVVSMVNATDTSATLMIEPWDACRTVRELWNFAELCTRPNVKLAWPVAFGDESHQTPAMVVPVLNLRLGMIRVRDAGATTLEYAKRLAGIGFGGFFVVDPPDSDDRLGDARQIVGIVRDLLEPRKPAKPPAKPAARPAAAK